MTLRSLTERLVTVPSHEDETRVGDVLTDWLQTETTASVDRDEVGNVIARRGTGPSLALVGHHDVVEPADSQVVDDETLACEERDGRLYGRGTADMKGALAALLLAFRDAAPAGELIFASFVGEEVGGVGARHAIDNGFSPAYAVVGEGSTGYSQPGVTDVAVAHKGRRGSTLEVDGVAAHASEADAGTNAIYRACGAIDELRSLPEPTVEVAGEQLTGRLTVTEIEGGSAMNVVPDVCTITVDERTVPGERADLARLESLPGVSVTVEQDLPPMYCSDEAFAEAVLAAATDAQADSPALVTKPHATDAGWLAKAGTACVICGPAEPGEAHTADESVSLAVLERCRETYQQIAERWPPDSVAGRLDE